MNDSGDNLIPDDYWNSVSQEEMEALQKAADEANAYLEQSLDEWDEMNDDYYNHLRERFKKNDGEIGPRQFKQFQHSTLPIQMIVIPAGRQHSDDGVVSYYHTITEDLQVGECNGSYELLTEKELEEKFNIKYNN